MKKIRMIIGVLFFVAVAGNVAAEEIISSSLFDLEVIEKSDDLVLLKDRNVGSESEPMSIYFLVWREGGREGVDIIEKVEGFPLKIFQGEIKDDTFKIPEGPIDDFIKRRKHSGLENIESAINMYVKALEDRKAFYEAVVNANLEILRSVLKKRYKA